MKRCASCKQWKDEEGFNWRNQAKGVRQPIHQRCQQGQRQEPCERHMEEVKGKSRATRQSIREEAEKFVYEYLSNSVAPIVASMIFLFYSLVMYRGGRKRR